MRILTQREREIKSKLIKRKIRKARERKREKKYDITM